MSDINIPGVTNDKIDTQKMIKAIMDAERVPLTRMESEMDTFNKTKKIWQNINLNLPKVKDPANELYSFNTPFPGDQQCRPARRRRPATARRPRRNAGDDLRVKQIA